jgi:hypothetical protein
MSDIEKLYREARTAFGGIRSCVLEAFSRFMLEEDPNRQHESVRALASYGRHLIATRNVLVRVATLQTNPIWIGMNEKAPFDVAPGEPDLEGFLVSSWKVERTRNGGVLVMLDDPNNFRIHLQFNNVPAFRNFLLEASAEAEHIVDKHS